jgi:hypothetical protein
MGVKSVKHPVTSGTLLAASAAVALATFGQSPAHAGDAFLRGFVGGMVGGMVGNMLMEPRGGYGHRPSRAAPAYHSYGAPSNRSHPAGNGAAPSPEESSRALASLAPPTTQEEQVILKSVKPGQSLGAVGATDDLDQIGKDYNADANRDYTSRVDDLIKRIQEAQSAQHSTKEGDVTEHAILEALTASITNKDGDSIPNKDGKLFRFETFLGENWSPERLRVMILDQVMNEIGGLFDGTNRGAVTMNDLNTIIGKSARNVYARLFETSELLAANRSSTLFLQRLYQTHGDLVNGDVRESAEQLLADASAAGLAPLDPSLRRDPNAFALRYRAERIIYDCLTDNVETMTSNESGMAAPGEISKRVLDVTNQQCAKWASAQLLDSDGKIKAQDPMPLRVVWTAKGPNDDDPSMYGRASDQP